MIERVYYRPSRLVRHMWPVTSYLVTIVTVTFLWVFFFVLNRTRIHGREYVGDFPNTLLLANHQSMIDSFVIGLAAFYPRVVLKPRLLPWNPAAVENFFRGWLLGWLSYNWRCIPVREGRRDARALRRLTDVLPIGRSMPRIGRRIRVVFGPPVEYPAAPVEAPSREAAQQLVDQTMTAIRAQLRAIRRGEFEVRGRRAPARR